MPDDQERNVDEGEETDNQSDDEQTESQHEQANPEETNGGTDEVETVTGRPVGEADEGLVMKLQQSETRSKITDTLKIYGGLAGIYAVFMIMTSVSLSGAVFGGAAGSVLIGAGPLLALYLGEMFTEIDEDDQFVSFASFLSNSVGYFSLLVILGIASAIMFGSGGSGGVIANFFLPTLFAVLIVGACGAGRTYYELNY